ncbi:MAG: hypothetical protein ACLFNO_03605 [Parcubacteria group bacterium]
MCTVKEHEKLKDLDFNLVKKYGDAQVIESKYHNCMGSKAIKVLVKVPPMNDWTLRKVEKITICNLGKKRATFVEVPKHFVKSSSACGVQVIQNFYLPVTCLGETMEVFADVRQRVNHEGMTAYVINYYEVPADLQAVKAVRLKIGTPKRYPNEVKRIPLPNGAAITFVGI